MLVNDFVYQDICIPYIHTINERGDYIQLYLMDYTILFCSYIWLNADYDSIILYNN